MTSILWFWWQAFGTGVIPSTGTPERWWSAPPRGTNWDQGRQDPNVVFAAPPRGQTFQPSQN